MKTNQLWIALVLFGALLLAGCISKDAPAPAVPQGAQAGQQPFQARIRDLAKGLIARFERAPELVGPLARDYECVAERVAVVLGNKAHVQSSTRT